jgi:chromosome partitioning protein
VLVLGRYLARRTSVALLDYDESQHLTDLVHDIAPDGVLTNRLRLASEGIPGTANLVLIDSAPARGPETRQALVEADYVLIPAPPERMAVRAMIQMLDTVEDVQKLGQRGNPYLQILGVLPTLYDQRWPIHVDFLSHIAEVCSERGVRLFPPIPRRQSYQLLSLAGQDYLPVATAISQLLRSRTNRERLVA